MRPICLILGALCRLVWDCNVQPPPSCQITPCNPTLRLHEHDIAKILRTFACRIDESAGRVRSRDPPSLTLELPSQHQYPNFTQHQPHRIAFIASHCNTCTLSHNRNYLILTENPPLRDSIFETA